MTCTCTVKGQHNENIRNDMSCMYDPQQYEMTDRYSEIAEDRKLIEIKQIGTAVTLYMMWDLLNGNKETWTAKVCRCCNIYWCSATV